MLTVPLKKIPKAEPDLLVQNLEIGAVVPQVQNIVEISGSLAIKVIFEGAGLAHAFTEIRPVHLMDVFGLVANRDHDTAGVGKEVLTHPNASRPVTRDRVLFHLFCGSIFDAIAAEVDRVSLGREHQGLIESFLPDEPFDLLLVHAVGREIVFFDVHRARPSEIPSQQKFKRDGKGLLVRSGSTKLNQHSIQVRVETTASDGFQLVIVQRHLNGHRGKNRIPSKATRGILTDGIVDAVLDLVEVGQIPSLQKNLIGGFIPCGRKPRHAQKSQHQPAPNSHVISLTSCG